MSFRSAVLSLALCCAAPVGAVAQQARLIELGYEISFAGLPGFRIDIAARIDGDTYDIESHTFKEGLIKAVTMHYVGRNRAWGRIGDAGAQPAGGSLSLAIGDKARTWLALYGFNGAVRETHNPDWKPQQPEHQISDEQRRGSLDPLSAAMFAAFAGQSACDRTIPTFDGKRRIDIVLARTGTDTAVNTGMPAARGQAIVCSIHTRRVAGEFYDKADETESERQRPMRLWFAQIDDSTMRFPVRLEAETGYGTIRGKVVNYRQRPLTEEERVAMRR